MAKGSIVKQEVFNELLKLYGNKAFMYNDGKELRINMIEDGAEVQLKVTLTAAKTPVSKGEDTAFPSAETQTQNLGSSPAPAALSAPTQEELDRVQDLIAKLSL